MKFSKGELQVMQELWDGDCLDENGEIQAIDLAKIMKEKYDIEKTSCYTFLTRLLEKNAISRRYPKYTLKPIVSRKDALRKSQNEAIDLLFQGSLVNICRTFLKEKNVSKEEIEELEKLIDDFKEE